MSHAQPPKTTNSFELVDEITARLQAGEPCDVDEYAARFPQHAERLRDWMTVMSAMADLGHSLVKSSGATAGWAPPEGWSSSAVLGGTPDESVMRGSPDPAHPAFSTGLLGDFRILLSRLKSPRVVKDVKRNGHRARANRRHPRRTRARAFRLPVEIIKSSRQYAPDGVAENDYCTSVHFLL